MPEGLMRARLIVRENSTSELWRLWFVTEDAETGNPVPFIFKAGQYCTLGINGVERAYSIVSAPFQSAGCQPLLEIFVGLVRDGELTSRIGELDIGDSMSIRPRAKGRFLLDKRAHHHFMVATVTGVAPYMSIIRQYLHEGGTGHKFYVLLGASYQDELTYDAQLAGLALAYPDSVMFIPTISRPDEERNAEWEGVKGRVNAIAEGYLKKLKLPKNDTLVYACGHPGMIEDIKERLVPKGWKIEEERFWKEVAEGGKV